MASRLVPNGSRITVRQLLNHSSGLPEFDQDPRVLEPYLAGNLGYHWAPRELVTIAVEHKPLLSPGTRYSYSNTSYLLAGLIAQVSTGKSLEAFYRALLEGKVLAPRQLDEMKKTLAEGRRVDFPGSRYGFGLESVHLPCGRAWGHGGNFPGYIVYALTSEHGDRQAVVLVNEDPGSLAKAACQRFLTLVAKAYCS